MNRRLGRSILITILIVLGCLAVARAATERDASRWHDFLRRNDAVLLVVWVAALPLLWGISAVRSSPPLRLAALVSAAVAQGALMIAMPAEMERIFAFFLKPLTAVVGAYCAFAWLIGRSAPRVSQTNLSLFLFSAGLGLLVAASLGWEGWVTNGLPPDFHDEYAYLFQAWTYLDGRFAYPTDSLSDAFDQVHVLNDTVFASRYFPGTALWMAPFVAAGFPIAAMWLAHALASGFFSLIASRIDGRAGWIAGLMIATAPGMIQFSDALLSTGPTTAALGAFICAWFTVHERRSTSFALIAASTIGFAFLSRPLTAAAFGFPFAAYSLFRWWSPRIDGERRNVVVMTTAFLACAALLPAWSVATIGAARETPYDRYTRLRTPSHVYGFYNAERGRARWTDRVFRPYDAWAHNLTPTMAIQTLDSRFRDALREGEGGYLFGALFVLLAVGTLPRRDDRVLMLWLATIGLALAYVPYWFVGLSGFGYFAEALPVLLTLGALTATWFIPWSWGAASPWSSALSALILLRVLSNVGELLPKIFEPGAAGQFARSEKKQLVDAENAFLRIERCNILVLVEADPKTAVHSTLVNNHPRLDAPVVRAWVTPELHDRLLARYSDRAVYLLEYRGFAQPFDWRRIRGPTAPR